MGKFIHRTTWQVTLKAVSYDRLGGWEMLESVDLPEPAPGPGQRVIVRRTGGGKRVRGAIVLNPTIE